MMVMGTPGRSRGRTARLAGLLAVVCGLVFVPGAGATVVLSESWELGTLDGWTLASARGGPNYWHVQTDPQTISVYPGINPPLVTLPDAGALPSAFDGNHAAWFGEPQTGTYCGQDFATNPANSQPAHPKDGCDSSAIPEGELVSPPENLSAASSAILQFSSWFEIESRNSNAKDTMRVDYSTDNGTTWTSGPALNPQANPAGTPDQSYSSNGLEQPGSWAPVLVDLSAAIGYPQVRFRFVFDAGDNLFNGFRGWLVDSIVLRTPFDASPAQISSVDTCGSGQDLAVLVLHGQSFIQGSTVMIDAKPVATAVPSSTRAEIAAPVAGTHTLDIIAPNGQASNSVSVIVGGCAGASGAGASPGGGLGQPGSGPGVPVAVPLIGVAPSALINGLRVVPKSFRAGVSARSRAAVSVLLSTRAPGPVTLTSIRLLPGRIGSRGACLAPTFARRRARSCTRAVRVFGAIHVAARGGMNVVRFTGRAGLLALAPGRYGLVATPAGSGPAAAPAGAAFTVTSPSRHPGVAPPPLSLR